VFKQMDGKFKAYAADSGKPLWSFYAANGVIAPPITIASTASSASRC